MSFYHQDCFQEHKIALMCSWSMIQFPLVSSALLNKYQFSNLVRWTQIQQNLACAIHFPNNVINEY